jgi:hypothetical protein
MRLNSQSNQFIFNLPSDFVPKEISTSYEPLLEKNWSQYDNVIDYLNSTIKSVSFPGISIDTPEQRLSKGKTRNYYPAKNVNDIFTTHELPVTFASVDSDTNYWIMVDILMKHYLDVSKLYINPLVMDVIDIHRDVIYSIKFFEIIGVSISDITFDYSQQKVNQKEFTVTFKFNFIDIEFNLNKSKVLGIMNDGNVKIINK